MKTKNIQGTGIVGRNVELSIVDMFALSQLAEQLETVNKNHAEIQRYNDTPYDKRVDENGNKMVCPKRIELDDKTLANAMVFIQKMAGGNCHTEIFNPVAIHDQLDNDPVP